MDRQTSGQILAVNFKLCVKELTYSSTDGHEHVADNLRVVHHDGLHCAIQHADLQRPLLLLVLQSILTDKGDSSGALTYCRSKCLTHLSGL